MSKLYVHVYAPEYFASRRVVKCNTCRKRRRCVVLYYEWQEPLAYCTGCGEMPDDWPRRFNKVTFARQRSIERAKQLWKKATDHATAIKQLMEFINAQRTEATA